MMSLKLEVFFLISQKHLIKFGISDKLLSVLSDFLKDRKQRVTSSGQVSSWIGVNAGVHHELILGPLIFVVYINNLADGLSSNAKLFADDTSLFLVIHSVDTSAKKFNNDLYQINKSYLLKHGTSQNDPKPAKTT